MAGELTPMKSGRLGCVGVPGFDLFVENSHSHAQEETKKKKQKIKLINFGLYQKNGPHDKYVILASIQVLI